MEYQFPPIDILSDETIENSFTDREYVQAMVEDFSNTMKAYDVNASIADIRMTPFAVIFDVMPDPGVSVKDFRKLRTEFELFMASPVEITSEGIQKYTVGIAIKSLHRPIVRLRSILESGDFKYSAYKIPVAAGMNILGAPLCFDIAETPHLLVAGTTGSGKSVFLNDIVLSILYSKTPEEVKLIMIDPKHVELGPYNGIPHLMFPVIYNVQKSLEAMRWVDGEMDRRYKEFDIAGVKHIDAYNHNSETKMPRIVVIVDEYMEMMFEAPKELENLIMRISRMARAAGIHLVLATQRPSSDIITSGIKANIPCRASFTVVDWRESKTIIDRTGAERLLGSGDMLYSPAESAVPIHAQASFASNSEIDAVIHHVRKNREDYDEEKITKEMESLKYDGSGGGNSGAII